MCFIGATFYRTVALQEKAYMPLPLSRVHWLLRWMPQSVCGTFSFNKNPRFLLCKDFINGVYWCATPSSWSLKAIFCKIFLNIFIYLDSWAKMSSCQPWWCRINVVIIAELFCVFRSWAKYVDLGPLWVICSDYLEPLHGWLFVMCSCFSTHPFSEVSLVMPFMTSSCPLGRPALCLSRWAHYACGINY